MVGTEEQHDEDVELLDRVCELLEDRGGTRASRLLEKFVDMKDWLSISERRVLSEPQRDFARTEIEKRSPTYANEISNGLVPRGKHVETIPMLRRENLPLKPPGRM